MQENIFLAIAIVMSPMHLGEMSDQIISIVGHLLVVVVHAGVLVIQLPFTKNHLSHLNYQLVDHYHCHQRNPHV